MSHKLLIITDLDGSLLDESYSWAPAQGSLDRLEAAGIPVILNSSKTLAEMVPLAKALGTPAPLVAENGGVHAFPVGSPLDPGTGEPMDGYRVSYPGLNRAFILEQAHGLRETHAYTFAGFADWSSQEIADITGLDLEAAGQAGQRLATEPIIWKDTDEAWQCFREALAQDDIRAIRGGRFTHLMGESDKVDGLRRMVGAYRDGYPEIQWTSVALGDSPNDQDMLEAADIAVVIPDTDGHHMQIQHADVIYASAAGPAGWHLALQEILNRTNNDDREQHHG